MTYAATETISPAPPSRSSTKTTAAENATCKHNKDVDDPLLYHLVINTDLVPFDEAARMIATPSSPSPPKSPDQRPSPRDFGKTQVAGPPHPNLLPIRPDFS